MRRTGTLRILFCLVMLCVSVYASAQSSGDKLFMEGQKFQQTQTIAAQNQAIKKFRAAKVVYTTADKKTMCDNQIKICENNIISLRQKSKPTETKVIVKESSDSVSVTQVAPPVKEVRRNVELSLSETRLDFKCKPKEGATQSVNVKCNYDDWEISSQPEWTTVYTATGKLSVEVTENETEEDRSGVIKVKCGEKEVDLVVNQAKAGTLQKIGGFFKKKKK